MFPTGEQVKTDVTDGQKFFKDRRKKTNELLFYAALEKKLVLFCCALVFLYLCQQNQSPKAKMDDLSNYRYQRNTLNINLLPPPYFL